MSPCPPDRHPQLQRHRRLDVSRPIPITSLPLSVAHPQNTPPPPPPPQGSLVQVGTLERIVGLHVQPPAAGAAASEPQLLHFIAAPDGRREWEHVSRFYPHDESAWCPARPGPVHTLCAAFCRDGPVQPLHACVSRPPPFV
jgi:hypothetical protein